MRTKMRFFLKSKMAIFFSGLPRGYVKSRNLRFSPFSFVDGSRTVCMYFHRLPNDSAFPSSSSRRYIYIFAAFYPHSFSLSLSLLNLITHHSNGPRNNEPGGAMRGKPRDVSADLTGANATRRCGGMAGLQNKPSLMISQCLVYVCV